jgi:hypothetical protein
MLQEASKDYDVDTDLDQNIYELSRILILNILGEPFEQKEPPLVDHDEELETLVFGSHCKIEDNEGNSCEDLDH